MKRTFIAVRVDPGSELQDAISFLRAGLRSEKIKWVEAGNIHVTLAFIGNTDEQLVKSVGAALENDFKGFGSFKFKLTGLGVFRNFTDPKIIRTGIKDPEGLNRAHEIVRKDIGLLNIKLEDRQFKPHLTIARIKEIKDKNNLKKLIQKYADTLFQDVTVSEIVYYESILLPAGPLYKPISIIKLI